MALALIRSFFPYFNEPKIEFGNHEREAAKKIVRAMRNFQSPMKILNDESLLLSLDHTQMKRMIKLVNKQKMQRSGSKIFDKRFTQAAFKALTTRLTYHNPKYSYPLFTHPGNLKKGKLPVCQLISHKKARSASLHNDIFVIPASKPLFEKMPFYIPTKNELDSIVVALRSHPDFPWEYISNGCQARSNLTLSYLKALNINLKCISQIFSIAPDLKIYDQDGKCHEWDYHVAPYVQADDGEEWIIDPSLCPDQALSLRKWIKLQREKPTNVYTVRKINTNRKYTLTNSHPVFLNVPCNHRLASLNYANSHDLVFVEFNEDKHKDRTEEFKNLSSYRFKLERNMLIGTYYKTLLEKHLYL